jgi:hypothetical protein
VQDLAESRKYDFIFDKSSDFNNALLIWHKRSSSKSVKSYWKREQLTKKQQADLDAKEKRRCYRQQSTISW